MSALLASPGTAALARRWGCRCAVVRHAGFWLLLVLHFVGLLSISVALRGPNICNICKLEGHQALCAVLSCTVKIISALACGCACTTPSGCSIHSGCRRHAVQCRLNCTDTRVQNPLFCSGGFKRMHVDGLCEQAHT